MELFMYITGGALLLLNIILLVILLRTRKSTDARESFVQLEQSIGRVEKAFREEFRYNREADENRSRQDREELAASLNNFRTEHREALKNITTQTNAAIEAFQKSFTESMNASNRLQREKLGELSTRQQ